jgi:hypothetical protein
MKAPYMAACRRTLCITIVTSLILCSFMISASTASASTETITVFRENIDNPAWTCDDAWDQDNKEKWIRGDTNSNSGVDTWCHSTHRKHGGTHSAWVAVIGYNSISVDRGEGNLANFAIDRYDANMSAYMRHSLTLDQALGDGTLTFYYWADTMASNAPGGYDHLQVSTSSDNSSYDVKWTQPSSSVTIWTMATVVIPADTRTLSFDFISGAYSSGTDMKEGAYVDDILVTQESTPSWSSVEALPAYSPTVFPIDIAADTSQGTPESVRLYYRATPNTTYALYHDQIITNGVFPYGEPIYFNASLTGGEAQYQFSSVAVGGGITEAQPSSPDASTIVDMGAPTTTLTQSGQGPVTLHLSSIDSRSGVDHIEFSLDGTTWAVWNQDVTISSEGVHNLSYRATDVAGNVEDVHAATILVDHTSPQTAYTVDATPQITLTARDSTSGINKTYYRVDGGEWSAYSSPLAIRNAGHQLLEYYSVDNANNTEIIRTLNLTDIPLSNIDLALGEVKQSYVLGELVSITWSVNDSSGLVDHYDIFLDGLLVETISSDTHIFNLVSLSEGNHSLLVSAVDSGGNSTQINTPVVVSGSATSGTSPLGLSWELWIIIAIVLLALVLLGLFLWRKKRE